MFGAAMFGAAMFGAADVEPLAVRDSVDGGL